MVLVPEDVFTRFEQRQKLETSPITANMMQKDTEMSNILHRTDMDDAQKQKLYYANLERYLNLRQQKDDQVPTVQLAIKNIEKDESKKLAPQEIVTLPDSVIVDNIPKAMRSRATTLLKRLKARPDVISWDESGQVSLDGEKIPRSNISDLIRDALRGRKNFNPTGSRQFFRTLSKLNMPKDLVRNEERWKQIDISSSDEETLSKHASPSSNYFQSLLKRHEVKPDETQKHWVNY